MKLEITDTDLANASVAGTVAQRMVRAAAYFLLHSIGDMPDEESAATPTGTVTRTVTETATAGDVSHTKTMTTTVAPPPPPPPPTDTSNGGDDEEGTAPPPPPANLGNVPPPPSAASNGTGANTAGQQSPPTSPPAPSAAGAGGAASAPPSGTAVTVDSAGMPWDERIHQASKGTKKDGSWKLKKIFDSTPEKEAAFAALVEQVTKEHAAKRGAALPVTLPAGGNTLPVPPPPQPNSAASGVPTPPAPPSVPVPPSPAAGAVGTSPYQTLIDKIIALTKEGKITHIKVNEMCQHAGATSLMALGNSPHLVAQVEKNIDAAVLGLM